MPGDDDVSPVIARVKLDKPSDRSLAIELDMDVMKYIYIKCAKQRVIDTRDADGGAASERECDGEVLDKGLSRVRTGPQQGTIRAVHKTSDGKKITKFFKTNEAGVSRTSVIERAEECVAMGRPTSSVDVSGDDGMGSHHLSDCDVSEREYDNDARDGGCM